MMRRATCTARVVVWAQRDPRGDVERDRPQLDTTAIPVDRPSPVGIRRVARWSVGCLVGLLGLGAGCHRTFVCSDSSDCGPSGQCEASSGFCSFADDSCASGRRYGAHAALDLVDVCVDENGAGSGSAGGVTEVSLSASDGSTNPTTSNSTPEGDDPDDTSSTNGTGEAGHDTSETGDDVSPPQTETGSGSTGAPIATTAGETDGETGEDCGYLPYPPQVISTNSEELRGYRIIAEGDEPAIVVHDATGVQLRNLEIIHERGPAISITNAPEVVIENVVIRTTAAAQWPNDLLDPATVGIEITGSNNAQINTARLDDHHTGIRIDGGQFITISNVEVHDMRGGACISIRNAQSPTVQDFSCENDLDTGIAWPAHGIEIVDSSNFNIRRGLVDGINAPTGAGVQISLDLANAALGGGFVDNVDVIRMTHAGFAAVPGRGITFRETRARDNVCEGDQLQAPPESGGLTWLADPSSENVGLDRVVSFNLCLEPEYFPLDIWDPFADPSEIDFVPRAPIRIPACP